MTKDIWHYPRQDLAKRTLNALVNGPAKSLTLFGPRRTGKTEFLRKDLTPVAQKEKHRVAYVSFWRAPLSPLAVLLNAFETSLREDTVGGRFASASIGLAPKLTLSAPLAGAKAEAEIDLTSIKGKPPTELLLYLDDLIKRLRNQKRPTLLLLDEIQELARDADNRSLIASLRTSLDVHSDGVRAIFTGSSRDGLQAMFSDKEAPFFHFGTSVDLERLDERFVEHLMSAFEKTTTRKLDREFAIEAFEQFDHSPYFFRSLLELLALTPSMNLRESVKVLRTQIAEKLGYGETWLKLTPIQRATVHQIALGAVKPFSQETRIEVGKVLGGEPPSIHQIQSALRRMAAMGVVDRWSGDWLIDDPELKRWIADRSDITKNR